MEQKKSLLQSITIDAALISTLLAIIGIFGVDVGAWIAESEGIAEVINGAIAVILNAIIIYGRIRATKQIG